MSAKKILTSLSVFLLSGFIIIYIIIQLISGLTTDVQFQHANFQSAEAFLEKDCYLIRNENIVYAEKAGITAYSVSEAQKIGRDQLIATVFADTSGVDLQNRIQAIDEKISVLERSSVDTSYLTSDVSKIDAKIYDSLIKMRLAVQENDVGLIEQYRDDILINFNKRQVITSGSEDFENSIALLRAEKAALTEKLNPLSSVYAEKSGYFSTLLDGYETVFTPAFLENMTVDSFRENIQKEPDVVSDLAIGKITTDFNWNALCEVDREEADDLVIGKKYPITFLYSSGQTLTATLSRKVTQTDTQGVVLVFLIEEVPQDFDYTRKQIVRIVKESAEGLAFPVSALRMQDGQIGVYIIDGNAVGFRKVELIYQSDSQYFCYEFDANDPKAKEYLTRYDRVIISGKDLYVGKILD